MLQSKGKKHHCTLTKVLGVQTSSQQSVLSGSMSEYDNSAINRNRYHAAVNRYKFLLEQSRSSHYSTVSAENNGNPKTLWNTFKKILYKSSTVILPDHISPTDLANTFGHFLSDKIIKIRVALQSLMPVSATRQRSNNSTLSFFEPVSEDDILKIRNSSPKIMRSRPDTNFTS